MSDPTRRFSSRVHDYIKYRPNYPSAVIDLLVSHCALDDQATIADIGSGTGLFSKQLLATGARVIGIEPNDAMREAGDVYLADSDRFVSVATSAEATGLDDLSIDLIVAAQAFHWFDVERFRSECQRLLKPVGRVALIWNDRLTDTTPFLKAYEQLLSEHGTDYAQVNHQNVDADAIAAFFGSQAFHRAAFPNEQRFDCEGFMGRVRSSSYTPAPDEEGFDAMMLALQQLFHQHAEAGSVVFAYKTTVFIGELA